MYFTPQKCEARACAPASCPPPTNRAHTITAVGSNDPAVGGQRYRQPPVRHPNPRIVFTCATTPRKKLRGGFSLGAHFFLTPKEPAAAPAAASAPAGGGGGTGGDGGSFAGASTISGSLAPSGLSSRCSRTPVAENSASHSLRRRSRPEVMTWRDRAEAGARADTRAAGGCTGRWAQVGLTVASRG